MRGRPSRSALVSFSRFPFSPSSVGPLAVFTTVHHPGEGEKSYRCSPEVRAGILGAATFPRLLRSGWPELDLLRCRGTQSRRTTVEKIPGSPLACILVELTRREPLYH